MVHVTRCGHRYTEVVYNRAVYTKDVFFVDVRITRDIFNLLWSLSTLFLNTAWSRYPTLRPQTRDGVNWPIRYKRANPSTNQPTKWSTNQINYQPVTQPIDQPANQASSSGLRNDTTVRGKKRTTTVIIRASSLHPPSFITHTPSFILHPSSTCLLGPLPPPRLSASQTSTVKGPWHAIPPIHGGTTCNRYIGWLTGWSIWLVGWFDSSLVGWFVGSSLVDWLYYTVDNTMVDTV